MANLGIDKTIENGKILGRLERSCPLWGLGVIFLCYLDPVL